ncbi:ClpXP protease specificity-enhancing factor [Nitrincola tapanii]|uniref:ClpXP protease specificity-enhancing factor n=1 Tax=Nitrincola tapanii TaxID=1708751 RepID=A0A5A9W126_9GAMM|nr:ClpXP protease specificity-enhancing factor [Nitrincola tapanii]KAA0873919.1 ClpXP protease specificity-enhancing factor [Nitrincola tapanii]
MTPSRPYLLKALYEWISDNEWTPYIAVDTQVQGVMVPEQFVQDGQIVLNIAMSAVRDLFMDHTGVSFNARFGGVPMNVFVPTAAVLAIYARENGQGMGFGVEPGVEALMQEAEAAEELPHSNDEPPREVPPRAEGKPKLTIVKN